MNITAVTTFNTDGLNKYGRRMIETYIKHWSSGVPLHVYYEGWNPAFNDNVPQDELVVYKHLITESDWLRHFKHRHKARPTENYRLDAVRFSHKVAALLHAAQDPKLQFLIWIDGDIITHTDFDAEHLDTILPYMESIAWLDRMHFYPECGFYVLNMFHEGTRHLLEMLRRMYVEDKLFELKEWHDSYVLQQCVIQLDVPAMSLSGVNGFRTHHPLVNGPLGQWFDHLKGARKSKGKSLKMDMLVKRDEPYWKDLK